MSIDPELAEFYADLKRLNAEARDAERNLRALHATASRGGTGGTLTEAGSHGRSAGGGGWRGARRDIRDVVEIGRGIANGDPTQVAQGATGLLPRGSAGAFLAVEGIRYGVSETYENLKEVYNENKQFQKILDKAKDLGFIETASQGRAIQAHNENKILVEMGGTELALGGAGLQRDIFVTPANFVLGLLGFEKYKTSREIAHARDMAVMEALREGEKSQIEYYKEARLGNMVDAGMEIGSISGGLGTSTANRWQRKVGSSGEIFYRYDQAKAANRMWSAMQSPRAGPRSDVD